MDNKKFTSFLFVKKPNDDLSTSVMISLIETLQTSDEKYDIYIDPATSLELPQLDLMPFDPDTIAEQASEIDLVITVGGDGTLLYASSLFTDFVPLILPINTGSLGFLTPFHSTTIKQDFRRILAGHFMVMERIRLSCKVTRSFLPSPDEVFIALNEIVLDRGASSYLSNLVAFFDEDLVTNVQGDGLIIATPTGSTGYSLSANGPLCHPALKAVLFTPICPHTLSFRPVVVPADVTIKLEVSPDSRASAWASFDGRSRMELAPGDYISITVSDHTLRTIAATTPSQDFFFSLNHLLHWNERPVQKALLKSMPSRAYTSRIPFEGND